MSAEIVKFEDAAKAYAQDSHILQLAMRECLHEREIARQLDIPIAKVRAAIQRMTGDVPGDYRTREFMLELERMNMLQAKFLGIAMEGAGDVDAAKVALAVSDRKARMLGFDVTATRGESPLEPAVMRESTTEELERKIRDLLGRDTVIDGEAVHVEAQAETAVTVEAEAVTIEAEAEPPPTGGDGDGG